MTQFIVSYQDAVHLGPAIVGGKGWNLGRLYRYGFRVPEGSILNAQIYTQFMEHPTLKALSTELGSVQANDVTDAGVEDALQTLRMTIEAAELPSEVEQAVQAFLITSGLIDGSIAVRSSATTEDNSTSSFAGIHESFLHIKGSKDVLQAIKGCYASL